MATTAEFRNGLCIEHNGDPWKIVSFQHVKPGKGPAFVRTKIRNLNTGRLLENTFTAGVKINIIRIENRTYQFIYSEGKDYNLEEMKWMWDVTTIADKRIIENNQKGVLSKKYEPGPLSEMENALESFKNWYLKRLLQVI